ncbi:hypothetical protein HKX48_004806 [Thoreauomyces humboldtii]|nr:hypothetical protein HKX48_004806 [Thoreauomyces humboldtii]
MLDCKLNAEKKVRPHTRSCRTKVSQRLRSRTHHHLVVVNALSGGFPDLFTAEGHHKRRLGQRQGWRPGFHRPPEKDELIHKAVIDRHPISKTAAVIAANNMLVTQRHFQAVVDALTDVTNKGTASKDTPPVINANRCPNVLFAIDATRPTSCLD